MYTVTISSFAFRKVKKLGKDKEVLFYKVVEKLKEDPFNITLHTHKLKGELKDFYSCKLDYKERVIFLIFIKKEITIY